MAGTITHKFVSAKADGPDATLVRPSNWNANLNVGGGSTGQAMKRDTAATDGWSLSTLLTEGTIIGGTGVTSTLILRSTSGVGAAGADIIFQVGNNGATEAMRILNDGTVTLGTDLSVANGGTGASTFTLNGVLYGNAASAIQVTAQGAASSVLTANAGAPSFSASPTIGTSVTVPTVIGGTAVSSTLALRSTSGVGSSDAIIFQVGNNGATEAIRVLSSGNVGIGVSPGQKLTVAGTIETTTGGVKYPDGKTQTIAAGTSIARIQKTTGAQTLTSGLLTVVTFDATAFDTDSMANLATERLVIQTAGKYLVCGGAEFAANTTGERQLGIARNGSNANNGEGGHSIIPAPAGIARMSVSTILDLAVNDFLELKASQDSGGNLDLAAGNEAFLSAIKVSS